MFSFSLTDIVVIHRNVEIAIICKIDYFFVWDCCINRNLGFEMLMMKGKLKPNEEIT